ncbi:uncharacterized protein [Elaeis guineensis]|uniref:uncharacterized protein n=1 Tax=Elaeis guineensis var. tenera TaxID=51953 RepID=UPI003C6D22D1
MRETPFSLTFGMEAVIPVEIVVPSVRTENFDEQTNSERLHANLDLLEEDRERVRVRMAAYQHKVVWYYNIRVRNKVFRIDDLVLCKTGVSQPRERDKLAPNWKGLYQVDGIIKPRTDWLK